MGILPSPENLILPTMPIKILPSSTISLSATMLICSPSVSTPSPAMITLPWMASSTRLLWTAPPPSSKSLRIHLFPLSATSLPYRASAKMEPSLPSPWMPPTTKKLQAYSAPSTAWTMKWSSPKATDTLAMLWLPTITATVLPTSSSRLRTCVIRLPL